MKGKILLNLVLALLALILLIPMFSINCSTSENIKFLVLVHKENGERVSVPIAVILQPKYYALTIEKSNTNGEFFFEVPVAYFASSLVEWKNWWRLNDIYTYAGLKYFIPPKPDTPNVTLVIFGKEEAIIFNYQIILNKEGLFDEYPVEIVLPNSFEPYEVPYLKDQSFFAPINKTIIDLSYGQKYIPSPDFGEERIVLTPFEYKFYKAKVDLLTVCKIQKLIVVNDAELEEARWILNHSETYNPLAWGTNVPCDLEELKYYNEILKKIWD